MNFCTQCGKENENQENQFCVYCGAKMDIAVAPSNITKTIVPQAHPFPVTIPSQASHANASSSAVKESQPDPFAEGKTKGSKTEGSKIKKRWLFSALLAVMVLAAAGGVGAFIYFKGMDSLSVVGRFFAAGDSENGADVNGDEEEEEEISAELAKEGLSTGALPSEIEGASAEGPFAAAGGTGEAAGGTGEGAGGTGKGAEGTGEGAAGMPAPSQSPSLEVFASSELSGYPAAGIVDGDNNTAWAVAIESGGIDESVTVPFGSDITIYGIYFKNGLWTSQYDLIRNGRVKVITVQFDDGSEERLAVSDSTLSDFATMAATNGEALPFARPHTTSMMKLSISDVYLGAEQTVFITDVSVAMLPIIEAAPPSQALAGPTLAVPAAEATTAGNIAVEDEVTWIRGQYNTIVSAMNSTCEKTVFASGVTAYHENGSLKAIVASKGSGDANYSRSYYYVGNELIFAYYEGSDAHRFYVQDGRLIRWRYAVNSSNSQNSVNHDLENTLEYRNWESRVMSDAANQKAAFWQFTSGSGMAVREYILPGSDSRYISRSELDGLTKEELKLARNELYARHGRKFVDEGLNNYFRQFAWYYPSIEPSAFRDETMLNAYETANRDLIVQYEKEHGYQ